MAANSKIAMRRRRVRTDLFDRRAYFACFCLTVLWGLIHFRTDIAALTIPSGYAAPQQVSQGEMFRGSILLTSHDGTLCQQRLIDNDTWRIRDNGLVNCAAAQAQNTERWHEQMGDQRTTAIRDSFVNR